MEKNACVIGFILLMVSGFTGSMEWIVRLLGYMGIANGTAMRSGVWFQMTHKLSVLAVSMLALLQIFTMTGTSIFSGNITDLLHQIFSIVIAVCMLIGLLKKEENQ